MRNVAPSRSLVRRANQVKTLAFVIGAAGIFAFALGILFNVVPLVAVENPGFGLYNFVRGLALFAGVILIAAAVALGIRAFTWKVDNDLAVEIGRLLSPYLNDDYTLIRNISKLAIGYVDAALIGPPGVLIFRLFDGTGTFINEGENWMRVKGRTPMGAPDVVPLSFSPTRQTQADMDKVAVYLQKRGLSGVPMYGMVVLMKNPPAAHIERLINPKLPVVQLAELWQTLQRIYLIHAELDKPKADAVVRALYGDIL